MMELFPVSGSLFSAASKTWSLGLLGWFQEGSSQSGESRQFSVRLWDSRDLLEAIYRNFEKLPAEIQAELPLEKVWMLLMKDPEGLHLKMRNRE